MGYRPPKQTVDNGDIKYSPSSDAVYDYLSAIDAANKTLSNLLSPTAINRDLFFAKSAARLEADNTQTTIANATLVIKAGDSTQNNRGQLQLLTRSNNLALVPTPTCGLTLNPNVTGSVGDSAIDFDFSAGSGRVFKLKVDAGNVTNKAEMWQGGQKFFDILHNGTNVSQLTLSTSNIARLTITDSASTFSNTVKANVFQALGGLGTPIQFEANAAHMWFGVAAFSRDVTGGTGFETTEPSTNATFGQALSLVRLGYNNGNVSRFASLQLLYKLGINNEIPASGVRTINPGTFFVRGARSYDRGGFTIYQFSTLSTGTTLTINYGGQVGASNIGWTVGAGDFIESSGSPGIRAKVLSVTSASGNNAVVVVDQSLNPGNIIVYQDIAIFRKWDNTDILKIDYDGNTTINSTVKLPQLTGSQLLALDSNKNIITTPLPGSFTSSGLTGSFPGTNPNTYTVSTALVTANSRIFLTAQSNPGGHQPDFYISSVTPGTNFTITSHDINFNGTVAWMIVEP